METPPKKYFFDESSIIPQKDSKFNVDFESENRTEKYQTNLEIFRKR